MKPRHAASYLVVPPLVWAVAIGMAILGLWRGSDDFFYILVGFLVGQVIYTIYRLVQGWRLKRE